MEIPHRLCVAPMMEWTDRHCRFFHRLIAPRALLYTEMVTTGAVLHGGAKRFLAFDVREQPVALQLGGSEPEALAACARLAELFGYVEVNLNCGCPSERVQRGSFGACLMAEPDLVADCVRAMTEATRLPVTVKCRIGIDDSAELEFLVPFVRAVAAAGCATFVVHARKAWLRGLSPKENREVPPLRYPVVHALKRLYPELTIVLNGGIRSVELATAQLACVDGVMIGREAYENPWSLRAFETAIVGPLPSAVDDRLATRHDVIDAMAMYATEQAARGVPLKVIARHMLGLFNGLPGARAWRRRLATGMHERDADATLLIDAASLVRRPPAVAAA